MPTVCAAQFTARMFTWRLSWPSGETTRSGAPCALLEHDKVMEPLEDGGTGSGIAQDWSPSVRSATSEFSEISR
jgi:hypothetical protein